MIQYIENIEKYRFQYRFIASYHIVENNIKFFDISRYFRDIFDNIAIFSTNFSVHWVTAKKDYKWGVI